jgi:salicylate hydroxylase
MLLTGEKGSGAEAGTTVFDLADTDQGRVIHRAALLRELLAPLPPGIVSTSKKLVDIVPIDAVEGGVIELRFQDGSVERADALIGADGIFGFVRRYVLGANDATTEPAYAGWWDCRNLVPIEKAREKLGERYFVENRQYGWVGDGGFIMHDVLDNGKTVQCVGACREDGTVISWKSHSRHGLMGL